MIIIELNEPNGNNLPVKARLTFDTERKNKLPTVRSGNYAIMHEDGTASMRMHTATRIIFQEGFFSYKAQGENF